MFHAEGALSFKLLVNHDDRVVAVQGVFPDPASPLRRCLLDLLGRSLRELTAAPPATPCRLRLPSGVTAVLATVEHSVGWVHRWVHVVSTPEERRRHGVHRVP